MNTPNAVEETTPEAWEALARANRSMGAALKLPPFRARRRAVKVLRHLVDLEREQPYRFVTAQQHRRWHQTLCTCIEQAQRIVDRLEQRVAAEEAET